MWKPIHDPGPWRAFLGRKDIKGLPIMEARKIYLQEQLLFESYLNNLNTINTVNTMSPASAGAAGGSRKFEYAARYRLTYRGTGDTPQKAGIYDRVAISDLKRYWVDKGLTESVPLPQIPSNIGSDYFFIRADIDERFNATVNLITWGSLGRGRQRGQWTYSEYNSTQGIPRVCSGYYNRWLNGFGFGSSDLSTPAGKWKINKFGEGSRMECIITSESYELTEFKSKGSLTVTGGSSSDVTYIGLYIKDPSSGTGQDAVYLREDNEYKIYFNADCEMWRIDTTEPSPINCGIWTGNPTGTSPFGTYQLTEFKAPATGTYTVTEN